MKELKNLTAAILAISTLAAPLAGLAADQKSEAKPKPYPLKTGVDDLNGVLAHFQVVVISGGDHINAFAKPEFVTSLQQFLAKKPAK